MEFYTSIERFSNFILYRGFKNGKRIQDKIKFKPTLYLRSLSSDEDFYSMIEKYSLKKKTFETMSQCREFVEKYKDVEGFDIFGTTNYVTSFIQERWPNPLQYDANLINILAFDIEVDISKKLPDMNTADNEITAISLKRFNRDEYWLLGLKDYDKTKTISGIDPSKINFMKFDNELQMLSMFMKLWKSDYPDVVTGWNVDYFDVQYTFTRILRLFGEDKLMSLSPWGNIKKKSIERFGKTQYSYEISGITVIDFMDAFKKFGYKYGPQESYKLDHIAHVVLGERKLSYEQYGNLSNLYIENPQLYLDYALKDTYLIERMELETGLLSLVFSIAYLSGVNYSDTFGTVGIWETTIYRRLMVKNLVPPLKGSPGMRSSDLVGGYVKDPKPGLYKNVETFDLTSLYPMLMMQYNMGPDTIVKDKRAITSIEDILSGNFVNYEENYAVTPNGTYFRKDEPGIIPQIIEEYFSNRSKAKKQMLAYEELEQQIKTEAARRGLKL